MEAPADVGAIVLHFRNVEDTERCLASVEALLERPRRVLVVNNDADAALTERLQRRFPWAELRTPERNLGFGAGMNLGIEELLADPRIGLVWCLNNDLVLDPGCLRALAAAVAHRPDVAGACPAVYMVDGRLMSTGGMALPAAGLWLPLRQPKGGEREVPILDGACMLLSAEWLRRAGTFDAAFFANVEDVDLSLRLRSAGGRLLCVPMAKAFHKVSESKGGQYGPLNFYLSTRNWVYLNRKRHRAPAFVLRLLTLAVVRSAFVAFSWLRSRRGVLVRAHLEGLADALLRRPDEFEAATREAILRYRGPPRSG